MRSGCSAVLPSSWQLPPNDPIMRPCDRAANCGPEDRWGRSGDGRHLTAAGAVQPLRRPPLSRALAARDHTRTVTDRTSIPKLICRRDDVSGCSTAQVAVCSTSRSWPAPPELFPPARASHTAQGRTRTQVEVNQCSCLLAAACEGHDDWLFGSKWVRGEQHMYSHAGSAPGIGARLVVGGCYEASALLGTH